MKKTAILISFLSLLLLHASPLAQGKAMEMDSMTDEEIMAMIDPGHKEINFPDVKEGDWYFPFVKKLFDQGIMEGYPDGRFGSWDPINRAEFAKVIVKIQERLEQPWYEKHLISILLVAINVFGWVIVLAAMSRRQAQGVNVNVQYPHQSPNTTPDRPTMIAQQPGATCPTPQQNSANPAEEKNAKTNWWNQ